MNFIDHVYYNMQEEDENTDKYSRQIIINFNKATDEQKELLNAFCARLCGYQVDTIIKEIVRDEKAEILEEAEKDGFSPFQVAPYDSLCQGCYWFYKKADLESGKCSDCQGGAQC